MAMNIEQIGAAAAIFGTCLMGIDTLGESRIRAMDKFAKALVLSLINPELYRRELRARLGEHWNSVMPIVLFAACTVIAYGFGLKSQSNDDSVPAVLSAALSRILPPLPIWFALGMFGASLLFLSLAKRFGVQRQRRRKVIGWLLALLSFLTLAARPDGGALFLTMALGCLLLLLALSLVWVLVTLAIVVAVFCISAPFLFAFSLQRRFALPSGLRLLGLAVTLAGLVATYYAISAHEGAAAVVPSSATQMHEGSDPLGSDPTER